MLENENKMRLGPYPVRSPKRFVSGLVLIGISVFVLWAVRDLAHGTIEAMGPGLFPRSLGVLLGLAGVIHLGASFVIDGEPLEKWSLRAPLLVPLGILLFAILIRPCGLSVAGFVGLLVAGFATPEARPREVIIFALLINIACIVLFRYLLELAIPVLIIPGLGIDI